MKAKAMTCDHHDDHDLINDRPQGRRCGARATHRIEWEDGRYSFGCAAHLTIEASATVKSCKVVALDGGGQ